MQKGVELTVHPGHQDAAIDAQPPLLSEGLLDFRLEPGSATVLLPLPPRFDELLRFGEEAANDADRNRRDAAT
jgi:hypothetical protein